MSKRTDTCIERWWWQGIGVVEVEPTTKVINATCSIWNFQKPVWNVREFYFGGLIGTLMQPNPRRSCICLHFLSCTLHLFVLMEHISA